MFQSSSNSCILTESIGMAESPVYSVQKTTKSRTVVTDGLLSRTQHNDETGRLYSLVWTGDSEDL